MEWMLNKRKTKDFLYSRMSADKQLNKKFLIHHYALGWVLI